MNEKPSSVQRGDKFRDSIATLLRTKHHDAQTEVTLGWKKVDIVFSHESFGRLVRVGVECKDYETAITKDKLLPFVQEYNQLVEKGHLNMVLFVISKPASAAASLMTSDYAWLRLVTREQLEQQLLGINRYVHDLQLRFSNEGLDSYYVEGRIENESGSALEVVERWIHDETQRQPIAVMGGYGKGKSSFSLRLASRLAAKHLENPAHRIPILVRLGQVVHEADLEGLFGKLFTASQRGFDFSFETLMHLNKQGRLCVILDGFDEMKHAMSAADFKSNFKQFNRLLHQNSKVIILGRPNALPAETHELVFRGRREAGGLTLTDINFKEWKEYELAFFDELEVVDFLQRYMQHLVDRAPQAPHENFVKERVSEIIQEVKHNVLQRPVHAKIVAELASAENFNLRGFTKHTLYEEFITRIIERDVEEKRARGPIGTSDRREFQEKLAWWCWTKQGDGQGYFDRDEVPADLISTLSVGQSIDQTTLLDEYLVSSLTEAKDNGILYFAHRSFEEFLVSEYMRKRTPETSEHLIYSAALNEEIIDFLDTSGDKSWRMRWFETLREGTTALPIHYFSIFSRDEIIINRILSSPIDSLSGIDLIIILTNLTTNGLINSTLEKSIRWLQAVATESEDSAAIAALMGLAKITTSDNRISASLAITQAILVRIAQRMRPRNWGDKAILVSPNVFGVVEEICGKVLTRTTNSKKWYGISLDLNKLRQACFSGLVLKHKIVAQPTTIDEIHQVFGILIPRESATPSPEGRDIDAIITNSQDDSQFFLNNQIMGQPLSKNSIESLRSLIEDSRHSNFNVVKVREASIGDR